MKIEITNQELHEILTGLSVGRCRIRGRLNRTKRQLSELLQNRGGEEDEGRKLYLTSIIQLREIRIETINKIIEKLESYETD